MQHYGITDISIGLVCVTVVVLSLFSDSNIGGARVTVGDGCTVILAFPEPGELEVLVSGMESKITQESE